MQQEVKEKELLQKLKRMKGVEGRKPLPPTGKYYVESRGIRYHTNRGSVGGNTAEVMILVSVGSEFPDGVQVQHRERDSKLAEKGIQPPSHLSPIVTGLHEEAAADLMAVVSLRLQDCTSDLVRLCLDVPGKQRSKDYYLKTIEEFFENCQQPQAILYYLGHSEESTGNWCFKDDVISFQEIFKLYRKHCHNKILIMHSDCCYSGNWLRECAKSLDHLGIPPCGHRAREQGILIKVYTSCKPDQKASEPCYSVKGVEVEENKTLTFLTHPLSAHQTSVVADATRLACSAKNPDESCQSKETLENLKWEDEVRSVVERGKHIEFQKTKDINVKN